MGYAVIILCWWYSNFPILQETISKVSGGRRQHLLDRLICCYIGMKSDIYIVLRKVSEFEKNVEGRKLRKVKISKLTTFLLLNFEVFFFHRIFDFFFFMCKRSKFWLWEKKVKSFTLLSHLFFREKNERLNWKSKNSYISPVFLFFYLFQNARYKPAYSLERIDNLLWSL